MATLTTNVTVCLSTGSGGYADNRCGCVSTTGDGEALMKTCLARQITFLMEQGTTYLSCDKFCHCFWTYNSVKIIT